MYQTSYINWTIGIAEYYGGVWASSDFLYNIVATGFGPLVEFVLSLSEERGELVYSVLDGRYELDCTRILDQKTAPISGAVWAL